MKTILFFILLAGSLFSQTLPLKDSTAYKLDGTMIQYKVYSHAVYVTTLNKYGLSHGPFTAYYKNGNVWHTDNRINNKIEGLAYSFTPNGDTATIEVWKNSQTFHSTIFYSSHSSDPQKYYFVSKTGFVTIKDGQFVGLEKNVPDSLIEDKGECAYMWLKGKKTLFYGECPRFELIKIGEKPGLYSIRGDKKTFIRPITDDEKKQK